MNSTSQDIKKILEDDSNVVLDPSSGNTFVINIGREPATPDNVVTIYDTMSFPDHLSFEKENKINNDSVQIRVRATDYKEGWELINSINESLHGRANETWNDTFYLLIENASGPGIWTYDDNQRVIFLVNFNIKRR